MPRRKRDIEQELKDFESYERMKPNMKCSSQDEYFSMVTDNPIEAQLQAWKQRTRRGQCDHIDIIEVFKYAKDQRIIAVKYRCCRLRK